MQRSTVLKRIERSAFQIAAASILLMVAATGLHSSGPSAAELVLKDVNGHKVKLSDLRGKPIVLNFWATWCGPCNTEMPLLVQAEHEFGRRGLIFIGASLDDSKTRRLVPEFVSKYGVSFSIWLGADPDDLDRLGLGNAVPATAFIDAEGHVAARVLGQITDHELNDRARWLLERNGSPPTPLVKHLGAR